MRRWIAVMAVALVMFAVGFLFIIVTQRDRQSISPKRVAVLQSVNGSLNITSIDDLRVGNRKVVLCGAIFTRPQALRTMVTEAARRDFQGLMVNCKPVGAGTPCDGKTGSRLGDAAVVQCFTLDGVDLALALTQKGLLCGQFAQVGSAYREC